MSSYLRQIENKLARGVLHFLKITLNANRDLPYDDFKTDTTTATYQYYRVGSENRKVSGTQHKLFTSKSTAIMCTKAAYVKFNSSEAVIHTLVANTWYEFKKNIYEIYYAYVEEAGTIYIHCEGTLPEEARFAE